MQNLLTLPSFPFDNQPCGQQIQRMIQHRNMHRLVKLFVIFVLAILAPAVISLPDEFSKSTTQRLGSARPALLGVDFGSTHM